MTLKHLKQNGHIDVIFCTNDEMALGAADALLFGDTATPETIIVGVDGTPQARALIGPGIEPLRATVVQNAYKVAETALTCWTEWPAMNRYPCERIWRARYWRD